MTTIITVTKSTTIRDQFSCFYKRGGGRTYGSDMAASDPGGAAAYAMQIALSVSGPYLILGPSAVMEFIPLEFRSRK